MKKSLWFVLIVALASVLLTSEALAIGRVYARLPNNANSPIYNLRIKSLKATAIIRDQLAVTTVDQEFANDNTFRLEGFYVFKLPEGAQVHEMFLWINNVRVPYQIKKREDAIIKYTEIVSRMTDPAILEDLGSNTFRLRIFPFEARGTRRIEISYSQPLSYYKGKIQYTFPLDMKDYTSAAIETATLSIRFDSQFPVTAVETSVDQFPAAVKVTTPNGFSAVIDYGVERVAFAKDFIATFSLARGSQSMSVLTYTAPDSLSELPYFLLWSALPDTLVKDSVKSREVTFVADISSSMEGDRLAQLKQSLNSFVDLLTESDKFNIIAFSTNSVPFRPNLVRATTAACDSARLFVSTLSALGLTNFDDALKTSLTQAYTDKIRSAIIFVTDGQPTWGQTNSDSILASIRRSNPKQIRIFPIAIGNEPEFALMQKIAKQEGGLFTSIASDDSIYVKIKDLYRLLFLPQVKSINVNFSGITVSDTHPAVLPDVYAGDQLRLAGRYQKGALAATVTLTGMAGLTPVSLSQSLFFADTAASFPAVARYWGAQKIKSVLDMIALVGEKKELVDQVIALSMRYSVLTPYTAFLVVEPSATGGTAVRTTSTQTPSRFGLEQNYPNPFNPSTTIRFSITERTHVRLKIYNTLGCLVAVLVDGETAPGVYTAQWNAEGLPSGVYFYVLEAGAHTAVQKMILQK
ncbi:MAG TPA: VIT domain-containing protein [Bacteroidota bacterium]|nr:VIT domain-containing protein [Bacteroidota bacterium]